MRYLESNSTDPAYNLALEQYVFDTLSQNDEFFMLWQNRDAVIIGLHQNAAEEIDREYAERNGVAVVRRLSGGGAVFHDLGNLNYTFITRAPDADLLDFSTQCQPIVTALRELGVPAEISGRNDVSVEGRKISGSARYLRDGRLMHHGTLLFDTDLEKMVKVLRPPEDKIESKGVKSIRSRVTNIREHLTCDMTQYEFWSFMRQRAARDMPVYSLTEHDIESVETIRRERYETWDWNYGRSPEYSIYKIRRIPEFGTVRLGMEIKNGKIAAFKTNGDYFGSKPYKDVETALLGVSLNSASLRTALDSLELNDYYSGLTPEELINLILE